MVDEAVRINVMNNDELLNRKSEFNHLPVARVVVEKANTKGNYKLVSPGVRQNDERQ